MGTTYNAYLILDEKNVLVDTVKVPFYLEMLGRISEIIDPQRLMCGFESCGDGPFRFTHPDRRPDWKPTVITTERGQKGLTKHYKKSLRFKIVKSGELFPLVIGPSPLWSTDASLAG